MPCLHFLTLLEKRLHVVVTPPAAPAAAARRQQQQQFKRFPQCTPRPSAGNQNGERVGGKWDVCYFLRQTRDPRVQATAFQYKATFSKGGIDAEPRVVTFWPESRLFKRRWPNEVLLSSCFPSVGVWVRRSATCPVLQLCGLFKPTIGPWCGPFYTSVHVTLHVFTLVHLSDVVAVSNVEHVAGCRVWTKRIPFGTH